MSLSVSKKSIKEVYRESGIPNNGVVANEIKKFFKTSSETDSVVKKINNKPVRGYILIEPNCEVTD